MRSKSAWLSGLLLASLLGGCSMEEPVRCEFFAAGTVVTLTITRTEESRAKKACLKVEDYLLDTTVDWYPWADGELARLNTGLMSGVIPDISYALSLLLDRAATLEKLSNGRFNAGMGELTELWGFHRPDEPPDAPPSAEAIAKVLERGFGLAGMSYVDGRLVLPPQKIDLGGIAKGLLLEESNAILSTRGVRSAIIDIGGDLRVSGRTARIGIRSPFGDGVVGGITLLAGETIVSSGNYERYFDFDGKRYGHILDPATGYPVDHTAAVTVVHKDPVLADAAATALMVGGADEFDTLTAALGLDYALLISEGGDTVLTEKLRERLD